jgi:hypothetical protein
METEPLSAKAMLCDFAEVTGGKLFVSGAGINLVTSAASEPPHPVNVALAVLVQIPWTATNQEHRLTVELVSDKDTRPERVSINDQIPAGDPESNKGLVIALFNVGRSPVMQAGEQTLMPVALPMFGLPLPQLGSYFFSISLDGTEVDRVSFRMVGMLPGMFPGAPQQMM